MLKKSISYVYICLCWFVIAPISFLIPKKKGLILVVGKESGWLAGNTMYFFLHGVKHKKNVVFLTRDKSILKDQPTLSNHILLYPSYKSILTLLRASFLVVDHSHWSFYYPIYFFLSIRARRIHLWHGLTFKAVERGLIIGKYANFKARLFRRLIKYDAVISTSDFWTKNLYEKYFLYKCKNVFCTKTFTGKIYSIMERVDNLVSFTIIFQLDKKDSLFKNV